MTPLSPTRDENSGNRSLPLTMVLSALLHVGALAALIYFKPPPVDRPPVYKIEILGAAGPKKQMGVVSDRVTEVEPKVAPAPKAVEKPPEPVVKPPPPKTPVKAKPVPTPPKATPNAGKPKEAGAKTQPKTDPKAALPTAGSESKTGKGTDVTNMVADGIAFPYPVYLNNIIRQVILNFNRPTGSMLEPVAKFLIHRDGSVSDIEIVTSSGNRALDLEARGAVEATGASRAFGPLPAGFPDDVLPVFYTFAPRQP